jgi:hypothetical protein
VNYITRRFSASSGGLKSNLNKKMKTKNVATLRSRKSRGHSLVRRGFVLLVLALTCFALTPSALAKKKKKKTTPTGIIHSTRLFVEGNNPIDLTNFTGLSLQYSSGPGEGAIMSSFDDGFGVLTFYTKNGPGQPITQQMIIDEKGNVGIGTSDPQTKLEVNASDLFIGKSATGKFLGATGFDFNVPSAVQEGLLIEQGFSTTGESSGIYFDGDSITMWSPGDNGRLLRVLDEDGMIEKFAIDGNAIANGVLLTSSRRFKENVAPIANALDKVSRLQGVTFDWNKDRGGKSDIGFVAEDLGKVLPELVLWEKNGTDAVGLEYANVTAVTVEAIKELKTQKDQEIAGLKAENRALAEKLAALASQIQKVSDRVELKQPAPQVVDNHQ